MSFLNLELALLSVMADATTHPTEKELKMVGVFYGKGKRKKRVRRWYWGVKKRILEINNVIIQVAISFIEKS